VSGSQKIKLRPVQAGDGPFLLRVYASTREQELSLVPWSEAQKESFVRMQFDSQKRHYEAQFPGAAHDIICQDEKPVGRIFLARLPEAFHIADITVLPPERRAGIGSHVLSEIIREAAQAGKPVRIYIENFNPSLRLFERLGFRKAEEKGFHFLMEWKS
jgi:ribosomal protein S18 acetylase RimI-like enzyme